MEALIERLEHALQAMAAERGRVEDGEPWPLSAAYGTEPESDWGPKEVLAHVAEMLPFWVAQIDVILGARPEPVPPFGRVTTDPVRIERIGRDRMLPAAELFDHIDAAGHTVLARLRTLSSEELGRRGVHPRLGEMTIQALVERFIVGHVEDHVEQLRAVLTRAADAGSNSGDPGTAA
jgi:hypothetical protein